MPGSRSPGLLHGHRVGLLCGRADVYNTNLTLTADQKTIADFWADNAGATGTPLGHWIAIVGQLARNGVRHKRVGEEERHLHFRGLSLMASAKAYARVGIAVTDAFIGCRNAECVYYLQRPVTNIQQNIDVSWLPYLVTPNFPTYTSGHSTQSGAAAAVLTDMGLESQRPSACTLKALARRK